MSANLRRLIILLLGALLLVAPLSIRVLTDHFNRRNYQPPAIELADLAATPAPTPTAIPAPKDATAPDAELSQGSVWVDFAHLPVLDPGQFESLAAALAARGVGLRLWVGDLDLSEIDSPESAPDQSEELAPLLQDASGLVVVSPLLLWRPDEIAAVEEFVADGGRLLLISDPDVLWDLPWNVNGLGEPFGVVFNDDYLYDLSENDGNYTHFFQGEFLDQAAALSGSTVAFYGARSIGGPVTSQARSADTTQSSLRGGLTRFTTVAIGGRETNGTAGNVLAVGDFDVLTEPYVARHDNRMMLEFIADFLSGGQRLQTLPDFPGYLGKEVTLIFGGDVSVDAELLGQGGTLQQRLDETGRVLTISSSTSLTPTTRVTETVGLRGTISTPAIPSVAATESAEPQDLIYLGTFQSAAEETTLLANAGFRLVEEIETPEATETPPATPEEPKAEGDTEQPSPTTTPTLPPTAETPPKATPEPGAEALPTEGTETTTPEPAVTLLLETDSGPRLLTAETILILQQGWANGSQVVAVLGNDSQAISAGLERLLYHAFDDCVNGAEMSICPFFAEGDAGSAPTDAGEGPPDILPTQPEAPPAAPAEGEPPGTDVAILVIDDNDLADPDEASEAAIYQQTLTTMGYVPALWFTAETGSPSQAILTGYDWVIWSTGTYEASGPDADEQMILQEFVLGGGKLTGSGRNLPFGGESSEAASVIADVVKTDEVPALVVGFPDEPIELPAGLPPVVPIQIEAGDDGPDVLVALRRGPNSADADAPLMVAFTDAEEPDAIGIRLTAVGMPLNWLPDGYAAQLVQNMAFWMLAE